MTARRISWLLKYAPRWASARVRGVDVHRALGELGVGGSLAHPGERAWKQRYLAVGLRAPAVVFQKRSSTNDRRLARARRGLGMTSVYDLDDAPSGVEGGPAEEERVVRMMHTVDGVVVGSEALEAFARRHAARVCLVPSSVDTKRFAPLPRAHGTREPAVTAGWIGNGRGYRRELLRFAALLPALREAGLHVALVGAMGDPEIHRAFASPGVELVDEIDWTDDEAVRAALARFDIGLYPLEATSYNGFKCGFKAIQYMAMALPVVASPVGANRLVVENGTTGFHAGEPADWVAAILRLARDEGLRTRLGATGRERVVERYGLDRAAARLHAFAVEIEEGRRR